MDCDRFLELLSARLDGALTEAEEGELEAHLAGCPDCRAAGAQLAALQEAFPELGEDAPPESFARGVMDRIRAEEPKKVIPLFKRPQIRVLAGLAACLVLAVGLYGVSRPHHLDKTEKMDMTVRSFNQDAAEETADRSACASLDGAEDSPQVNASLVDPELADAPQVAAYAAPSPAQTDVSIDTAGTVPEAFMDSAAVQKASANPAGDGLEDNYPLVEGTTTLERMPEGAAELIPPETAVVPMDDQRGSIYLDLPLEILEQIERLAQEQGIGITAERCSAPEAEVQYNLEILQQNP